MNAHQLTQRCVLTVTGAAAAAGRAGCLGDDTDPTDDHGEEHAGAFKEWNIFVVIYHSGFGAFDENGDELNVSEIDPNTELTMHVVNDHANNDKKSIHLEAGVYDVGEHIRRPSRQSSFGKTVEGTASRSGKRRSAHERDTMNTTDEPRLSIRAAGYRVTEAGFRRRLPGRGHSRTEGCRTR